MHIYDASEEAYKNGYKAALEKVLQLIFALYASGITDINVITKKISDLLDDLNNHPGNKGIE